MVKNYRIPSRGDIIFLNFSPQFSHEQAGRRPALVVSYETYNAKSGLCLCVPITSQIKKYPFEVVLPSYLRTKGVILSDQICSLDWHAREFEVVEKIPSSVMEEVLVKVGVLVA